jgi:hypothetical protein
MPPHREKIPGAFPEDLPEMRDLSAHERSHARTDANKVIYLNIPLSRSSSRHRAQEPEVERPEEFYATRDEIRHEDDDLQDSEDVHHIIETKEPMGLDLDTGEGHFTNQEEFIKFIQEVPEEDLWKHFTEAQEQTKILYHELQSAGLKYSSLAQKFDEIFRKNVELAASNRQLRDNQSASQPANDYDSLFSMAGSNKRSAKYPDPKLFKGTSSPSFPQWRIAIQAKLDTNADHFQDEKAKVTYVYTRTAGEAAEQLRPYITASGHLAFSTVSEILEELAAVYIDPNEKQKARDAYRGLYQYRCSDLQDFHVKFTLNANLAGIPREMWLHDYYDKLSNKLQLALAPTRHAYTSLPALVNACRTTQNSLDVVARTENRAGSRTGSAMPATTGKTITTRTTITASSDSRWGDIPVEFRGKLTDALRATLIAAGRCFFCRKTGHSLGDCPAKKASDSAKTREVMEVADTSSNPVVKKENA